MSELQILPKSPAYFPMAHGRYDVTAGLKALGEKTPFEIDEHYLGYLEEKAASRREDPDKYHLQSAFAPALHRAVARYALGALAEHHPDWFSLGWQGETARFHNRLIGLEATIDLDALKVTSVTRGPALLPGGERLYTEFDLVGIDPFDFLALQTQEDWAVSALDPADQREWLAAIHLSFPNHWSPAEKIGRPFVEVHRPVAAIEPLLKAAPSLIDMMIHKGPWERFAWGVATDTHLNHHPANLDDPAHRARSSQLDPDALTPEAVGAGTWLRIERQVLKGFPVESGALFLIRTYFRPIADVARDPEQRRALAQAIKTMKPESVVYKGLVRLQAPLVAFLEGAEER